MRDDLAGSREDWARLILDTAPEAFIAVDAGGVITHWNEKAEHIFGWSRDEAVGATMAETIIPPELRTKHAAAFRRYLETGHSTLIGRTIELTACDRNGDRIAIELSLGAAPSEGGDLVYAFVRDITRRHSNQEILRARERQLSEALTLANLGSWSWDITTEDVTWSNELYLIFGLRPGEPVTFETYIARVHPDDVSTVRAVIEQAIHDQQPFEFDHRIIRADDGSVRWLHCLGEIVAGANGPERLYGTTEDVTEERQAERTQSLLAAIVESTDDAIKSMATDGTVISWNAAAEQLYGYTAEEFLGQSVLGLFPENEVDGVLAVFRRVVQGGHVERCELRQRRKDGTLIDVAATLSPIRVGGTIVGVSAVSRNVTARNRAQEVLESALMHQQRTVEDLQELDRLRNDFISDVSHELRTPLTSISGYAELLAGGSFGGITSQQGDALDVIDRNTKRLLDLIEDIMALSRMESGVFSLNVEPTDLEGLIHGAGDAIAGAAEAKQIHLTIDVEPDIGYGVVDPSQMDRALLNVLSNAVKFTPAGGRVRLHAKRIAGKVSITVSDTGIGIDAGDQQQVFKRFFRSSLATRSAIQGTGLGLVITKTIIDHHHGSIHLESEPGRGTTVHIVFPADAEAAVAV